jgi:D-alanyl-D-alanine-carboxypeptidase/D-alanyl-D-alanine-endopeptidase
VPRAPAEVLVQRMTGSRLAGCVVALLLLTAATGAPRESFPSDREIRTILAERAGPEENGVSLVVGLIGPGGRRVVSYGKVDGNTLFEIGSVGKVFTALLLADMAVHDEVALGDPVAKYLPAGVTIPSRNGTAMTLADLATHTSGLPFMPDDGAVTPALIYRYLAHYQGPPSGSPGWAYSNLGYWLLGEALSASGGQDFETLLRERILRPLRLKSTAFALSPALQARLAPGHDASLQPVPPVSSMPRFAMMAAAGVKMVSTANDLLSFLAVALGDERSSLSPAMAAMLEMRRPTSTAEHLSDQALGWRILGDRDHPLIFHDGGTFGYSSAVAWDPKQRVGVVVLSNQVGDVGDIARHLLRPDIPLTKTTHVKHTEIVLDAATLDSYAGRYETKGEGVFIIARDGDALTIQSPSDWGLPAQHLRAESRHDFFVSELPMRVTFQTGSSGVSGMVIYPPRGQEGVVATRIQ